VLALSAAYQKDVSGVALCEASHRHSKELSIMRVSQSRPLFLAFFFLFVHSLLILYDGNILLLL
jgi:hypothetical protein